MAKNAPSQVRGFGQGFCKRAGASGKKERTHRAPIGIPPPEPLPRSLFCPGFCYFFAHAPSFSKTIPPRRPFVSSQARKNPRQNKAPPGGIHPHEPLICDSFYSFLSTCKIIGIGSIKKKLIHPGNAGMDS
jgi:hypothetical protein